MPWLERLEGASGLQIRTWDDLLFSLLSRLDYFVEHGARAADHGLNRLDMPAARSTAHLSQILDCARSGTLVSPDDAAAFRMALLEQLGRAYAQRNMVMQLHIGPLRNNRTRLLQAAGRDAGGDSLRNAPLAEALNAFLDRLDRDDALPRTILCALDPTKTPVIVTTAGNFQDGSIAGKVQAGNSLVVQ